MSENTVNALLRRMGYPKEVVSAHASAPWHEQSFAPNGRAYNDATVADYLDGLRDGQNGI